MFGHTPLSVMLSFGNMFLNIHRQGNFRHLALLSRVFLEWKQRGNENRSKTFLAVPSWEGTGRSPAVSSAWTTSGPPVAVANLLAMLPSYRKAAAPPDACRPLPFSTFYSFVFIPQFRTRTKLKNWALCLWSEKKERKCCQFFFELYKLCHV